MNHPKIVDSDHVGVEEYESYFWIRLSPIRIFVLVDYREGAACFVAGEPFDVRP